MCGLFGAIGQHINPAIIRALAIVNQERGEDSLGFFSSSGKFVKRAGSPVKLIGKPEFGEFIDVACRKSWFLAGHTRAATWGKVSSENAHPFRYGRIIGAHNGMIAAPTSYAVDSQYLFDRLNQCNGDYQTAFADIRGYWALTWFDGEFFTLQSHSNELYLARLADTWYYSSSCKHLRACIGHTADSTRLDRGQTIRFTIKTARYAKLPRFVSTVRSSNVMGYSYYRGTQQPQGIQ